MTANHNWTYHKSSILIVDDETPNLKLLNQLLSDEGYHVRPVERPQLAIKSALLQPPSLILLDVKMPEMDGFEVCRRLKQDERTGDIPIIFVSALQDVNDRVRGFEEGGVDFISKPFQESEVLARVRTHLRLRDMQLFQEEMLAERTAKLKAEIIERKQVEEKLRASDERYKAFVENSTEGIWRAEFDEPIALDLPEEEQFELVYKHCYMAEANDAYALSVGFERGEELAGVRIDGFCPRSDPKNVATVKAWIRERYSIKRAETVESYQDGITRHILNNSYAVIDDGCVVRVWGTHVDITDQKALEEKLRESEDKYRTVADFTYNWENWKGPDGSLLYVSPSCENISGYTVSDFMDRPELFEEIILPEDLAEWKDHSNRVRTGKVPGQCRIRIRNKDGTTRWVEHVCQPVYDERGNYAGVRASNRDITDLKLAEQVAHENRETTARLHRMASLEHLAGSIAHELNQPLTGILSNAQAGIMLLEKVDGKGTEIQEILVDIIADSKRSGEIIHNIRGMLQMQSTDFKLLGVNAIIKETLLILKSELVSQRVTIHQDLSDSLPYVNGNRIQIQQVLINLINNAVQASLDLVEVDRKIFIVTARGNASEVKIHVEDKGSGIDQARLKKIFEPLNTVKSDGFGIGLSICRSIVRAHRGRIWAENVPGGGARVSFTLPAAGKKS